MSTLRQPKSILGWARAILICFSILLVSITILSVVKSGNASRTLKGDSLLMASKESAEPKYHQSSPEPLVSHEQKDPSSKERSSIFRPQQTRDKALRLQAVERKEVSAPPPTKPVLLERDVSLNVHVDFGPRTDEEKAYDANPSNFSTYHPLEAYRIRMKRKAMEEAALAAEYHKIKVEIEEGYKDSDRTRNCMMIILILIVIITIAFEMCCSWIMNEVSDFMKPVVLILFKELTVLGFIALLVFMSVKTGIPQSISRQIFGTPTELEEMFDLVHVLLFLVVVVFISLASIALFRFVEVCAGWKGMEHLILHAQAQGKGLEEVAEEDLRRLPPAGLFSSLLGRGRSRREVLRFDFLRHNFLSISVRNRHDFDPAFKFSSYLTRCTTHVFEELIEVEVETWAVVVALILFARVYSTIHEGNLKLAAFILVGVGLLAANIALRNKLVSILVMLAKPGPADGDGGQGSEPLYLFDARRRAALLASGRGPSQRPHGRLYRLVNGDREATPQEALFWLGPYGPRLHMHIIRTSVFLVAVYGALICLTLAETEAETLPSALLTLLLALPCPAVMMIHFIPQNLQLHVLCTSVEMLRRHGLVREEERRIRERRHDMTTRLLALLRTHADRIRRRRALSSPSLAAAAAATTTTLTPRRREIEALFAAGSEPVPGRPAESFVPARRAAGLLSLMGVALEAGEREEVLAELGRHPLEGWSVDGLLLAPTVDWLTAADRPVLSDQAADSIFVDMDGEEPGEEERGAGASRWDGLVREGLLLRLLARLDPRLAPPATPRASLAPPPNKGAEAAGGHGQELRDGGQGLGPEDLVDWLGWAAGRAGIAAPPHGLERVYDAHTFRALLRAGSVTGAAP